eukprot:6214772-Pleurochrysis_carterae.AAC.11
MHLPTECIGSLCRPSATVSACTSASRRLREWQFEASQTTARVRPPCGRGCGLVACISTPVARVCLAPLSPAVSSSPVAADQLLVPTGPLPAKGVCDTSER